MNQPLKIAIIQLDIANGDKQANILSIADKLHRVEKDTDLVVLPELCTTGFLLDTEAMEKLAEPTSGLTMDTMYRYAQVFNMAICGSFIAKVGTKYYNRGFFIEPSGEETFYDKRHLFSMSNEARFFSPGETVCPPIRFRGWNINMIICYDMRFPAWCRNKENSYDILVAPANWPTSRVYAWRQLAIARAIENQCFVIGANRMGTDEFGEYPGDSIIVDYVGHPVGRYNVEEGIVYATFTKDGMESLRTKFPVWKDADRIEIVD